MKNEFNKSDNFAEPQDLVANSALNPETIALVMATSLSMMAPLIAVVKALLQSGALSKTDLRKQFETALNVDNYPPQMAPVLKPVWEQLNRLVEHD